MTLFVPLTFPTLHNLPSLAGIADLTSLLRKTSTAAHTSSFLELLRTNHLVQAAARVGEHQAAHSALHCVLAQVSV
jgi:hypothetical protein